MIYYAKAFLLLITLTCSNSFASEWALLWKAEQIKNPESVFLDEKRKILFVSTQDYEKDKGGGGISQLSLDGTLLKKDWIAGLNQPKGVLVTKDTLFVSDVTELIEVDIDKAQIRKRHAIAGAKFLNDVAIDKAGNIYVSDMFNSAIYRLNKSGQFETWMQTPELENPNGLLVDGDSLYISAWGPFTDEKPLDAPKGNFLQVSLKTKKITKLSKSPLGNLDGVQSQDASNFILSDWIAGGVYRFTSVGKIEKIIDTASSAGDIAYLKSRKIILIPMAKQSQILAYKFNAGSK